MSKLWIQTRDGHAIDLVNPDLSLVTIEEVAHSLARINRYTGHTPVPYSVAQHSVLVSEHLKYEFSFAGLMHDAHESAIGDISSPVKKALALDDGGAMRRLEGRLELAFREKWPPQPVPNEIVRRETVRQEDLRALVTERRDLLGDVQAMPWEVDLEPWSDRIKPWDAEMAEEYFLRAFETLYEGD